MEVNSDVYSSGLIKLVYDCLNQVSESLRTVQHSFLQMMVLLLSKLAFRMLMGSLCHRILQRDQQLRRFWISLFFHAADSKIFIYFL